MKPPFLARLVAAALPIAVVAAALTLKTSQPAAYEALVAEDGIVEYAQVAAYLVLAALAFSYGLPNRTASPNSARRIAGVTVGLVCLGIVGEELSWGQRLLAIETPEWFLRHNLKFETNLHNLEIARPWLSKVVLGVAAAGAFAWWPCRRWQLESLRRSPFVPPVWLSTWFWPALAFHVLWGLGAHLHLGALARGRFLIVPDQEIGELLIAVGLVLTAARRVRGWRPGEAGMAPTGFEPVLPA